MALYSNLIICCVCFSYLLLGTECQKCLSDLECELLWPAATCVRNRCRCPQNTIKRSSGTWELICLSTIDATTGEQGPPLTCPLPEGAGYQVILRMDNTSTIYQCSSKKKDADCPEGYECIKGLLPTGPMDGVCCPKRETACSHPVFDHEEDGHLERWAYNGSQCIQIKWNPERPSTANNFKTKQHCTSYCIKDELYALNCSHSGFYCTLFIQTLILLLVFFNAFR